MRLDQYLVKNKLVQSRERAQNLITNGGVLVNGKVVTKNSYQANNTDVIEITKSDIPWVSRAGLKLEHALIHWNINVANKVCADFGACTGGFTEVLLSHGAAKVYAIDVGHGQLAEKLITNKRVINLENTHIKNLAKEHFQEPIQFICIDVSFISLEKILPIAHKLLTDEGMLIALIKPQFEVGKKYIRKGIVKDPLLHKTTVNKILNSAHALGFHHCKIIESPILGGKGNKEFLLFGIKKALRLRRVSCTSEQ